MGPSPDDGTNQVLRVILEMGVGEAGDPLQGTARVAGSSRAERFASALDLLRIIESEAARARRAHPGEHHAGAGGSACC